MSSFSSGQSSQNTSYHTIEYTSAPVVSQRQITVVFVVHARSLGSKLSIDPKALAGLSAASASLLSPASPSPSSPSSTSAVSAPNKCELRLLSLRSLLDYNEKDSDESTFEVSLFGEMFFSMLRRDFGLCILRALENFSRKRSRQVLLSSSLSSSVSASSAATSDQSTSVSDESGSAEPPAKRAKLEESTEESSTTDSSTTPYEPPSHIVPKTEPAEDEMHTKIDVEAVNQNVAKNETETETGIETGTENEAMEDSLPSPPSPFSPPAVSPPQEDATMHQPVPDSSDSNADPVVKEEKADQTTEPSIPDQTVAPPRVCVFFFPFLFISFFLCLTSSCRRRKRKRADPSDPEKLSVIFT